MSSKKILVIVESPSKCKKIESYLGKEYKVIASFGHIRSLDIKKGIKCISREEEYKQYFINDFKKKKTISNLKSMVSNCKEVILATDDDREGEAIAWHICVVCGLNIKTTKRIVFNEITKNALQNAVKNPKTIDMRKVNSQRARQTLDLLIGFECSPLLWKYMGNKRKKNLSAGRCQTPALRLIYDNHIECKNQDIKLGYSVLGKFIINKKDKFIQEYNLKQNELMNEEQIVEFMEQSKTFNHIITKNNINKIISKGPLPLITSSLQQLLGNKHGFSPKTVMSSCQKLYEKGYITYMRTDSKKYSEEFINKIKIFIQDTYGEKYIKKDYSKITIMNKKDGENTKKSKTKKDNLNQEAHECIRPTNIETDNVNPEDGLGDIDVKIYIFIRNHTLESCISDSIDEKLKTFITSPNEELKYENTLVKNTFPGWKIVNGVHDNSEEFVKMTKIEMDKKVDYKEIIGKVSCNRQKLHIQESQWVSKLENKGIGRPSTYASLIDKNYQRGYVKKQNIKGKEFEGKEYTLKGKNVKTKDIKKTIGDEKNKVIITDLGLLIIEFLYKSCEDIFNYDYTKLMENDLDLINSGEKEYIDICKIHDTQLLKQIESVNDRMETMNEEMDEDEKHSLENAKKEMKETQQKKKEFIERKKEIKKLNRINITEKYTFMIAKYGIVFLKNEKGKKKGTFIPPKEMLTFEQVKTWNDNFEGTDANKNKYIEENFLNIEKINKKIQNNDNKKYFTYCNTKIEIRSGKYGDYFNYKGDNYSLKNINIENINDTIIDKLICDKKEWKNKQKTYSKTKNNE